MHLCPSLTKARTMMRRAGSATATTAPAGSGPFSTRRAITSSTTSSTATNRNASYASSKGRRLARECRKDVRLLMDGRATRWAEGDHAMLRLGILVRATWDEPMPSVSPSADAQQISWSQSQAGAARLVSPPTTGQFPSRATTRCCAPRYRCGADHAAAAPTIVRRF